MVSKLVIGEAKTPSMPAMTVEITQLAPAKKSGEKPRTIAPFSFSAAARVASPNRVYLKTAHKPTATATTIATKNNWLLGIAPKSPGSFTFPLGRGN